MSEEVPPSTSNGQMRIEQFFVQNQENSFGQPRQQAPKRKIEEVKKTGIKPDSESSGDGPQGNAKEYNKITKYCPQVQKPSKRAPEHLDSQVKQPYQIPRQFSNDYSMLEQKHRQEIEAYRIFKERSQAMMAEALKQNEEYRRDKNREYLEKERYRLGEFIQKRNQLNFKDEWEDGYEIKQVKDAIKDLERESDELEQLKKELKSKSLQTSKKDKQMRLSFLDGNDNSNNSIELDVQQKKQRYSFQLSVIQKEMLDKKQWLVRLEEQKITLIQKLRKFADEMQCKYAKCNPPWPLLSNRYQVLGLLGKGGFSEVYKSFDLEEFKLCGCKIHSLNPHWSDAAKNNYIKHALRENSIHSQLRHHNIVQVYGTVEIDADSFCTVLEYCDGGDLSQHLKKYKQLTEKEAKLIIRQVLAALHYMSGISMKIIHYDLKPSNILFHKGEVKITDFGLCKIINPENTRIELTSQGLGTYWYLPPECFEERFSIEISSKVDVWSVGVILYEIIYGRKPFGDGMSQEQIAKQRIILNSTNLQFPMKTGISQECKDFISKCLTYNMDSRWTVSEAYLSTYINKN